ncbi:hypothetical protein ACFJGW_00710 [Burkholderiaceae bacterium UC74_6]
MRKPDYTPMPGSVAEKALEYFKANPTASLRHCELERALGIQVAKGCFNSSLAPARRRGILRYVDGHWTFHGGQHASA